MREARRRCRARGGRPAGWGRRSRVTGRGWRNVATRPRRSIEVARLELDDVDGRAGELVVRGKARRRDRLPLPAEAGEAMAAYLAGGRTPAGTRRLFLTSKAPRGPIRADLVGDVVERACVRAGLPRVGPHRLRHALAAELLRQGAGLVAISQVLRHQDLATTTARMPRST